MKLHEFKNITDSFSKTVEPPVLFIGHGNPMNVITENPYRKSWEELGQQLSKPNAILCISAHWYTNGTFITTNEFPPTIHDFAGFPPELYAEQYPAPGAPELAAETIENVTQTKVEGAQDWGLDHGAWCVLKPMFPAADIPVFQLSIDYTKPPQFHFDLAKELAFLRSKGVLIIGSGNIVHNLRLVRWEGGAPYDWALEFNETAKDRLMKKDFAALVDYRQFGRAAELSIPTNEHYLPLLYALGASGKPGDVEIFNDAFDLGSVSMMSVVLA